MKKPIILFSLFFIFLYADLIYGYNLRQLSHKDNLTNSAITSLCQDEKGLLWIGTCDGINIYDGRKVNHFSSSDTRETLSGNLINNILTTKDSLIWIQTYYGLERYNTYTDSIEHFDISKITYNCKDKEGNYFAVYENDSITCIPANNNKPYKIWMENLVLDDILNILIDKTDHLCIFTRQGSCRKIRVRTSETGDVVLSHEIWHHFYTPLTYCIYDIDDIFLIDTNNNLYDFDSHTYKTSLAYNLTELIRENGEIASMVKFQEEYYIGFKREGVYILKKDDSGYQTEKLPINGSIFCMLEDRFQDIVWIGTDGQGVFCYSKEPYTIKSIPLNGSMLGVNHPVRALFMDHHHTFWIGSKGDGILKIYEYDIHKNISDCRTEKLTKDNSLLQDNSVYCFGESKKDILWIGTEEGLNYYSYKEDKIKKVTLQDEKGIPILYIHDIYEQDSVLWIASVGMGGIRATLDWQEDTPTLKLRDHYLLEEGYMGANYFFSIHPLEDHLIYFSNRGRGFYKVDITKEEGELIQFEHDFKNQTLNETNVILKVGTNHYLIGTNLGLVEFYDTSYRVINKTHGFPYNVIHSILQESPDLFWLSTNQGVVHYNLVTDNFRKYDYLDGLQVSEFSDGAAFKDKKENIFYFGGINGFIAIKNEKYTPLKYIPSIYLNNLNILGKDHNIHDFLKKSKKKSQLTLTYKQNFFSFSFIAIDYLYGNNYQYYYRLDGLHKNWIDNGNSDRISFTNFKPGEYTLQVKYLNKVTNEESPIYNYEIRILPPWYQTSWASVLYIILFVAILYFLLRWFTLSDRKKREEALYRMQQKQKEEVHESKLRFFTNIAHEFCTPLTLIHGPCNRILNLENVDSNIRNYATIIQHNADRINNLVQDLFEFRRIETGYKTPEIEKLDITQLYQTLYSAFSHLAETRQLRFSNEVNEEIQWNTDNEFLTTILTNLLSNAFKYVNENGEIKINAIQQEEKLILTVSNTGKGIRKEEISKVFDRYSILDNFEYQKNGGDWARNGLGLAISAGMVNLLQGEIRIESTPGEWTTFSVILPFAEINTIPQAEDRKQDIIKINETHSEIPNLPVYEIKKERQTMLIIDDQREMLWLIGDIFYREFNVIALDNLQEAEEALKKSYPDIILSDVTFPESDGISFARNLKSNPETAHIPIILLSARHDMEIRIEGLDTGAELYITKPFDVNFLKTSVYQSIKRKEILKDYFSSPLSAFDLLDGKLTHKEHTQLITRIADIINKNIKNKDLSVSFIAEEMNMSTRNLYRKVQDISPVSIAEMIRESRLHIAENLLKKSKLTIDEIIFESGFANRVSFFKAFSKKYGCTPKEYRDKNSLNNSN